MHGILNVLKPPGMTSHDVVYYIRRVTGQKKVGHTGTLDPGAAGVLTICLGQATGIIQYLHDDKGYQAEITFGVSTSTQDAYGNIVTAFGAGSLTMDAVQKCLPFFTGCIPQIPPMTSAIKHRGKKLYELARAGVEVERPPRTVNIYQISLADFQQQRSGFPRATLVIHCSKGTYIRTLCHDLGEKLGCGAYMSFLLRTRVGHFQLKDTLTLEEIKHLQDHGNLEKNLIPASRALEHLPKILLQDNLVRAVRHGNRFYLPQASLGGQLSANNIVRLEDEHSLLALARVGIVHDKPGHYLIQPVRVFV